MGRHKQFKVVYNRNVDRWTITNTRLTFRTKDDADAALSNVRSEDETSRRVCIAVTEELYDKLKVDAALEEKSVSAVARKILEDHYGKKEN